MVVEVFAVELQSDGLGFPAVKIDPGTGVGGDLRMNSAAIEVQMADHCGAVLGEFIRKGAPELEG